MIWFAVPFAFAALSLWLKWKGGMLGHGWYDASGISCGCLGDGRDRNPYRP